MLLAVIFLLALVCPHRREHVKYAARLLKTMLQWLLQLCGGGAIILPPKSEMARL